MRFRKQKQSTKHAKYHQALFRETSCNFVDRFLGLTLSYLSLAPLGTSSVKVAITGLSFSPTEAASNIPCDS